MHCFILEIELLRLADYESLLGSPRRGSQLDPCVIILKEITHTNDDDDDDDDSYLKCYYCFKTS